MSKNYNNGQDESDCVFGTVTRQRVIAVEKWMGILSHLVFWLFAASFTTLGTAVVALVITLLDKPK